MRVTEILHHLSTCHSTLRLGVRGYKLCISKSKVIEVVQVQADREHAWPLTVSAWSSDRCWDHAGMHLLALMSALTTGVWLSACAFTPAQCLQNALSGYYMVLFSLWEAANRGGKVQDSYFADQTLRCLVWVAAHMVERVMHQSGAFDPLSTLEACAEQHFGRVKASSGVSQGSMNLKSYMLSLHRLHLRQAQQSPQSKAEVPEWHGMPHESAKGIGSAAFHSVCVLKAVASSSQNPKEIGRDFLL